VLRLLSGGAVVHSRNRTLDPVFQFLWRTGLSDRNGRPRLGVAGRSLDEARADWNDLGQRFAVPPDLSVQVDPVGSGGVSGLLIRPFTIDETMPLLVFLHQGGGVLGGPMLSRAFCSLLAHGAKCPVFLPGYRLAPENRFPAALDDALAAADWAQAHAVALGAPCGQIAVGGALTGGGLAARLCLELRRTFRPLPVAQLLLTPLLDLADPGLRHPSDEGLWPLNLADLNEMLADYTGGGHDPGDPRLSPAREKRLPAGLPPALIISAGFDPLAAQAETYARRLIQAHCATIYRRFDDLPLGFDLLAGLAPSARQATLSLAPLWRDLARAQTAAAS
jgi:acetyl esterase